MFDVWLNASALGYGQADIGRLNQPLTAGVALLGVGFGEGSLVIVRRLLALPDGRGSVQSCSMLGYGQADIGESGDSSKLGHFGARGGAGLGAHASDGDGTGLSSEGASGWQVFAFAQSDG